MAFIALRGGSGSDEDRRRPAADGGGERATEPAAAGAPPQLGDLPSPDGEPLVPIIDEIVVEKPEVCRGEENLISVRAHTEGGKEDAFLHYFIVDDVGASRPLRLSRRSDEDETTFREIAVFGRNNVRTTARLPPYTIKDCEVPRKLYLDRRLMANTESEFELTARIQDVAAPVPMKPVRYEWDFGDGATATTTDPFAVHDYGARRQDTMFTNLVISCVAVGADGERLLGRTGFALLNPAFEELAYRGRVRLSAALEPRFPELGRDGVVRQQVRVWHHRPGPVQLDRIVVMENFMPDARGRVPRPRGREVDPAAILGTRTVPPGPGITAQVKLDDEDIYYLDFQMAGKSAEGLPAEGSFSVMRPPPKPEPGKSRPVLGKYMQARIRRAQQLLGKDVVTDEDLWRLDRQGKMADLRPEDFPEPPPEPEPVRPPPGPE